MLACLHVLQGVAQIGRLLEPHGLTKAEAAQLISLSKNMGAGVDHSLTALLRGLVR
jgi:hypothetical protein